MPLSVCVDVVSTLMVVLAMVCCVWHREITAAAAATATVKPESPLYFLATPNELRLETEETVTITTYGATGMAQFHIYLEDYPERKTKFSERMLVVEKDEIANTTIKLTVNDLQTLTSVTSDRAYMYLVCETVNNFTKSSRSETILPLSHSPGYIFIQTDKPLYTPDQTVYLRVMALNEHYKPVDWPLQIDVLNPNGLAVSRQKTEGSDVIFKDSMRIPDNPVYGNWTVRVNFANGLATSSSVRFEVREYVLPTFGVTFHTKEEEKVVLPTDKEFHTTISARYVFGKPVKGHVTVNFGLIWHGHVFTLGKKRNMELNETGHAVCTIPVSELRLPIENVWFPNGGKLHMEAIVTEYASGKVERARDNSVVFADSLYIIRMTRSSRYFKPGLTYSLKVDVIKANGQPGHKLPVKVDCSAQIGDTWTPLSPLSPPPEGVHRSDVKGYVTVTYPIASNTKRLEFKVQSLKEGGEPDEGTAQRFGAVPFYSTSGTYLQVDAVATSAHRRGQLLEVGDYVTVTTHYTSSEELNHVNLMVLSRGQIVWQKRTNNLGLNSTTFYFPLSRQMLPSARIVAFSIRGHAQGSEVISDTVLLEMKPTCFGEIELSLTEDNPPSFRPGDIGSVSVKGLKDMRVGLLAVDQAVYLLNEQSLSRKTMFDALLEHDLGCGDGRGDSSAAVFRGSGLTILSNTGLNTLPRTAGGCKAKVVRRRRSTSMEDECCLQGAKFKMDIHDRELCHKAAKEVKRMLGLDACAQQFFRCCADWNKNGSFSNTTGRIQGGGDGGTYDVTLEDDIMIPLSGEENINIRSNFPESWWFEDLTLGSSGKAELDFPLPDSITTWVIQAVGVSPEAGLCVAPPLNVTAFRPFFLHVDLPYAAVRLEQLEVRATIYNYMQRPISVRLFMQSVDGVCYSGASGKNSEAFVVDVDANDATSVYFPIVPLEIGRFPVRVFAISAWGRDAVEKVLRVEGEGLEKVHTVSVLLDPSGKRFVREKKSNQTFSLTNKVLALEQKQEVQLDLDLPAEVIPDTESCTVSAMGDLLGPTVRGVVEGAEELLRLPTGCGEQNLIYMGPNVYTMRYLKATGRLTSTVEKKARAFIRQGLMRQMTFRKDDGSFGTWPHADSSTWLTAFAMKVLCQTNNFVPVDMNATCASLHWLRTRQRDDGSFIEDVWVTHREMLGGINGDMSVTAFVLIAMLECHCMEQDRVEMIDKAQAYLELHLEEKQRPLTAAITAYALALAGSEWSREFNMKLMDQAHTSSNGLKYWHYGPEESFGEGEKPYWYAKKPNALSVETTAYALLTQLTLNDVNASNPIVAWLLEQREEHGSFVSTQDTVIALQALSEYSIKSFSAILDMTCHVRSEVDDQFQKTFSLTREDALVLKSVPQVPTGGKLLFEASGTGVGVMHVDVRFNVPDDENVCRFDLTVTSRRLSNMLQHFFWRPQHHQQRCEPCSLDCEEEEQDNADSEEEVENFTFPAIVPRIREKLGLEKDPKVTGSDVEDGEKDEQRTSEWAGSRVGRGPMSRIGRPRFRRSALIASSARVLCVEVCARYRGDRDTGMVVMDIGLFTGYKPISSDLHNLKEKGRIDHFEMSERSVVMYIDEISHKTRHCVKFRAKQNHVVENIQPAKVQVYDYYNPEERCTVFYKPDNASGQLANFCDEQKRICQCLEGRCGTCEELSYDKGWMEMYQHACHNSTNVLSVRVLDRDLEKVGFERLLGVVEKSVYQSGKLQVSEKDKVVLLKRDACICPRMKVGSTYLIMLQQPKKFRDVEGNQVYVFLLDKRAMVYDTFEGHSTNLSKDQKRQARKVARVIKRASKRECRPKGQGGNNKGKAKGKVKGKRRVKDKHRRKVERELRRRQRRHQRRHRRLNHG